MSRTIDDDDVLGCIVLGSTRSPGVVTLSGHDREKAWDIKAAKGQTGASSALNGDPIGKFRASFQLTDEQPEDGSPDEFTRWDEFQRLAESTTNGAKPIALPVFHPDLARNHFTEVTMSAVSGLIRDGKGGATAWIDFIEYRPPKPKPAAKAQAKPSGPIVMSDPHGDPHPPKPDPNAAAKAELAGLVAEARKP